MYFLYDPAGLKTDFKINNRYQRDKEYKGAISKVWLASFVA